MGFPPIVCTSFLFFTSLYNHCSRRTHSSLLIALDFLCSYLFLVPPEYESSIPYIPYICTLLLLLLCAED